MRCEWVFAMNGKEPLNDAIFLATCNTIQEYLNVIDKVLAERHAEMVRYTDNGILKCQSDDSSR